MKVGIITLHKVPNYGSALQAFALQAFLQKQNINVELIDYKYPNDYHLSFIPKKNFYKICRENVSRLYDYWIRRRRYQIKAFERFYKKYYCLTPIEYLSVNQIEQTPPIFDIYITGSDQVWNPKTLFVDPVMFCSFAPLKYKRISFSASFSNSVLPEKDKEKVKKYLDYYSAIGVREKSSLKILYSLNLKKNIKITCTCDPTLLLSSSEYSAIGAESTINIKQDYILVYLLNYAYDPEPAITYVVEDVVEHYGCDVVFIGHHRIHYKRKHKYIKGIGPCDFITLIENAKFIITSSFHGTMFAIIFRKPFVAITPAKHIADTRIIDVLNTIGLRDNYISSDKKLSRISLSYRYPYTQEIEDNIEKYINSSKKFLLSSLLD